MPLQHDASSWARLQSLYSQGRKLSAAERSAFVEEVALTDPAMADEVASLLEITAPSTSFFRRLERTLFDHSEEEDTGAVLARFDPLVGTTLADRYEIEGVRGRGGMGTVYRAKDSTSGVVVALKVLSLPLRSDEEARARFFQEARAAARLDHPNVCGILGVGEADDRHPFLVMPFYDGITLRTRLRSGRLPLDEALDWFTQACEGLQAVHDADIVHRDVSPGNLLRSESGTVRVLDFGLARIANATLETGSRTLGTLPYMSPEQLRGEKVDRRTDVWAIAAVLYHMLAGRRPFGGKTPADVHSMILGQEPGALHRLNPEVSEDLAGAVGSGLKKELAERADDVASLSMNVATAAR